MPTLYLILTWAGIKLIKLLIYIFGFVGLKNTTVAPIINGKFVCLFVFWFLVKNVRKQFEMSRI